MYFIYNLKYVSDDPNCYETKMITEWGLLQADTYVEAMETIDRHYGEDTIEEITYLAPFTDNSVVVIDKESVAAIKMNEQNTF